MRQHSFNGRRRDFLSGILLAMLLLRAYIPAGFMPASGTPFLLELCPAASSLRMPAHHQHDTQSHTHFDNCPFGSAPAAGPISHCIAFEPPEPIASPIVLAFEPLRSRARPERAHPPRGPPSPA
jgi:hypothetical protein